MLFAPRQLGNSSLSREELAEDKKKCIKIGPCGIGDKAIYLNSFFIDRTFYVHNNDVRRVYKRVAMTKGGFTGKGMFASLAYLVVVLSDGTEKQCNFKYEYEVDNFIDRFHAMHPSIPTHSEAAEKRMEEDRRKEEARYLKDLSPEALEAVAALEKASDYLKAEPAYAEALSRTAKQKRIIDHIRPEYKIFAGVIVLFALAACGYGIYAVIEHKGLSVYFLLFGFAAIFYAMSMQVLPTGRNNAKNAQKEFDAAVKSMESYIAGYAGGFPVPAQYAHPSTIARMIRVIREGRAGTVEESYEVMKSDLKAINNTVTVSQTEYDEITAIKPMFLNCGYADQMTI
jgi:hypothetical protein